jgi:HD-GYP domain-containing protein (c-di-GMP phosphodiesterase class II)
MKSVALKTETEILRAEELVAIDPTILKVGEEVDFPVLQQADGLKRYVLLLPPKQRVTERLLTGIGSSNNGRAFTKRRYALEYEKFVESRMAETLADESIPLDKRSGLLYGQVTKKMKDLFEGEIKKESLEKATGYADHISNFMGTNPKAVRSMMAMTINDYYTFTHSIHVCIYGTGLITRAFAEKSPYSTDDVAVGLLLHDIGKARVDTTILNKPGGLDPQEWEVMKQHPIYGHEMLEKNGIHSDLVKEITLYHHERLNGKGYPHGLKGEKVTLAARIAAIADTFDAMTTNRPYKKAMPIFDALNEMKELCGPDRSYDQALFDTFVKMMSA